MGMLPPAVLTYICMIMQMACAWMKMIPPAMLSWTCAHADGT